MNNGFFGYPDRGDLQPSSSINTVPSGATYRTLLLAGRPDNNTVLITKNGSALASSDYTVSGNTVTFTVDLGPGDVIRDDYLTGDQVGTSRFGAAVTGTLQAQTLALLPMAYWPLNDTSGTTARDISGNARHCTYQASPTLNQTPIFTGASRSVLLDGSTQYANYTGSAFDSVASAWSMQVVAKLTANNACLFTHLYSGTNVPFSLHYGTTEVATNNKFGGGFYTPSTWRLAKESGTTSTSTAVHLVVTWDGTTVTLYKNGTSAGTTTPGVADSAEGGGIRIGRRWDNGAATAVAGTISDVAFWNTALSSTDVSNLYATLS